MTILHPDELRDMTPAERAQELADMKTELLNARAVKAAGGAPENPARISELRKTIARIKTIQGEEGDDVEDVSPSPVSEVEPAETADAGVTEPVDEPAEDAGADEDVAETDLLGDDEDQEDE